MESGLICVGLCASFYSEMAQKKQNVFFIYFIYINIFEGTMCNMWKICPYLVVGLQNAPICTFFTPLFSIATEVCCL